jgi:hypothetical protein
MVAVTCANTGMLLAIVFNRRKDENNAKWHTDKKMRGETLKQISIAPRVK